MRTIKELHILFREAVSDTFFIWRKEAGRVVRDQGVLIFFILVPVLYPCSMLLFIREKRSGKFLRSLSTGRIRLSAATLSAGSMLLPM